MDKILLSVKEICEYTGWGETKVRSILNKKDSTFTVRYGNRLYAHKILFDNWLEKHAKYGIAI